MSTPERTLNAHQLQSQLENLILSGRIGANQPLPSVRQLARDAHVSTATVSKVYRILADKGLVVAKSRSVTAVAPGPHAPHADVLHALESAVSTAKSAGVTLTELQRLVVAVWQESPGR